MQTRMKVLKIVETKLNLFKEQKMNQIKLHIVQHRNTPFCRIWDLKSYNSHMYDDDDDDKHQR